jgi:hypothetical protein
MLLCLIVHILQPISLLLHMGMCKTLPGMSHSLKKDNNIYLDVQLVDPLICFPTIVKYPK